MLAPQDNKDCYKAKSGYLQPPNRRARIRSRRSQTTIKGFGLGNLGAEFWTPGSECGNLEDDQTAFRRLSQANLFSA